MKNFPCLLNCHITASHSCTTLTQASDITFAVRYNAQSLILEWQILIACIQCWDTPEYGQRTCAKHVEACIIRIYHDAWSYECPNRYQTSFTYRHQVFWNEKVKFIETQLKLLFNFLIICPFCQWQKNRFCACLTPTTTLQFFACSILSSTSVSNLQLTLNKESPIKKESPVLMVNDTLYFHGHKTSSQEHVSLYQITSHICLVWKLSETH